MAIHIPDFDGHNGMDVARARIAWEDEHRMGTLDLSGLDLESLPPELAAFSHLRELRLGEAESAGNHGDDLNNVKSYHYDMKIISKNSELNHLYLHGVRINDLSFIHNFPNLLSLACRNSKIGDLSELRFAPNLTFLDCSWTKIRSLAGLKDCIRLHTLDCSGTEITSLAELKNCINLHTLNCPETEITSLAGLEGCTDLHMLDCSCTGITSLAGLEDCTSLHTLNCYNTKITSLAELESCTSLHTLDCSGTEITNLAGLEGCASLHTLDCSGTEITNLAGLEGCASLHTLDCSWTKIASLIALKDCIDLHTLNCSSTDITFLAGLESFSKLSVLNFSSTEVYSLKSLALCTNIGELYCFDTKIESLAGIENFTKLHTLSVSDTQVSSLLELKNCTNLRILYGSRSKITNMKGLEYCINIHTIKLPGTKIKELENLEIFEDLRILDISGTEIKTLKNLKNCKFLRNLYLSFTDIKSLVFLKKCINLTEIDCHRTQITNLSGIEKCINLKEIRCSYSNVSSLVELENCINLHKLDCSGTRISSLSGLENCINLHELDCSGTQISSLAGLENCINLHELDCSGTQISSLDRLKNCINIHALDCSFTEIDSLNELEYFHNLRYLKCSRASFLQKENCLELISALPIEHLHISNSHYYQYFESYILSNSSNDNCLPLLRAHFSDLRQEAQEQRDFKILVLGNGQSGKTQLVRRLCSDEFADHWDSTHGIQLAQAHLLDRDDGGRNRLNIWDFGGQELYHGTHALFLRQASAVIINWAADTEQESEYIDPHGLRFRNHPVGYWLTLLDNLVPTEVPRLLVQSKIDLPANLTPILPDNHQALPQIRFSAKTKQGLGQVKGGLQDAIATVRQHHRFKIGAGRQRMIDRLLAMAEKGFAPDQRLIDRETFADWCQEIGQISDAEQLLIYLDRTGLLIYRPEHLGDRIILDQSWALNALYTLFQRESCYRPLIKQGGRFTAQQLRDLVWRQDFSAGEQSLFLGLMQESGICFVIDRGDNKQAIYLAPDLLPERADLEREIGARWVGDTPTETQSIVYRFRHPGVLRALIGKIGRWTKLHALYWRSGLCAYDDRRRSRLLVEEIAHSEGWGCRLELTAKDGKAAELLAWVLKQLEGIHQSLGIQPDSPIPEQSKMTELSPPVGSSRDCDWYVSYAWGDDSPEGQERDRVITELMKVAKRQNISIRRDSNHIKFGESIHAFMKTLARGQRIFILLSDKYLRSPFCTYELYHIWRECRQDADEFMDTVRIYQTSCAQISTEEQRVAYYEYWQEEFEKLSNTIKRYKDGEAPEKLQEKLKIIRKFKGEIGDILEEIIGRLQPRQWEDFITHGFTH